MRMQSTLVNSMGHKKEHQGKRDTYEGKEFPCEGDERVTKIHDIHV